MYKITSELSARKKSLFVFSAIVSLFIIFVFFYSDSSAKVGQVSIALACKRDLNNTNAVMPVQGSCMDVVLVGGNISKETVNKFKELVESADFKHRGINTVCFVSGGGEPESGYDLAVEIKKNDMTTCIADFYARKEGNTRIHSTIPLSVEKLNNSILCSSTCPFVFLAGRERILFGQKIKVEVHKPGSLTKLLNLVEVERKDIDIPTGEDFFLKMSALVSQQHHAGVEEFYKKAMGKKFSDSKLLEIPNDELVRMNVVTKWDKADANL